MVQDNASRWQHNSSLPPLEFPLNSQILLYVLYSLTTILSFIGNSLVIYVLVCGARAKKKLNTFLINLAVSDLMMACFCMPYTFTETMLGRWVFGDVMCPLVNFMQVVSVSVSIFTNTAIALDRYRAVTSPMDQRFGKNRAKLTVMVIWVCALCVSVPLLITMRSYPFVYGHTLYQFCDENWVDKQRTYYTFSLLFFTYIVPLTIIGYAYYRILNVLRTHALPGNSDTDRDDQRMRDKKKVIKMLIVIVSLFALSWLPIHIFSVIQDVAPSSMFSNMTNYFDEILFYGVFYGCHWLAMSNSLVNPIIYSFMNDYFKADMRYAFSRKALCACVTVRKCNSRRSTTYALTNVNKNIQERVFQCNETVRTESQK